MASTGLSRRKMAAYLADAIVAGNSATAVRKTAAELIETGRTKEAGHLASDVEKALIEKGTVVATVTTATSLSDASRDLVQSHLKKTYSVSTVILREVVDLSVLGGVRIDVAGKELDTTFSRALTALKNSKL